MAKVQPHITLGDVKYALKPLTVRQVRDIENVLMTPEIMAHGVGFAVAVIGIALSRDHADVVVDDLETNTNEIKAALEIILTLGGFVPGEAKAAA